MIPRKKYRSCPQSPLEFKDVEMQKWWLKLFDELEEIHFKERHKIGSIVNDVVTQRTYDILKPVLNLDQQHTRGIFEQPEPPTPEDFRSLDRETVSDVSFSSEYAEEEEVDEEEEEWEEDEEMPREMTDEETVISEVPVVPEEDESEVSSLFVELGPPYKRDEELDDDYTNHYLKFLKLPKVKAAIWRTMKDPIPTGLYEPDPNLNLEEKAALVTYLISKEFYDWFKSIGGTEVHTFSDKVLSELFCVGFDQLAAHALCSRMQEMPSVPTEVAVETGLSMADYRLALKREIERDSCAEKIPRRHYAFGSTITYPDRWVPPHNNADTWLKCSNIPTEIASFSMVWQGITEMSSTKAFVQYLKERPNLPRPQYLQKMCMFDAKRSSQKGSRGRSITGDTDLTSDLNLDGDRSSVSSLADSYLAKYGKSNIQLM